jgi:hypothetical protein
MGEVLRDLVNGTFLQQVYMLCKGIDAYFAVTLAKGLEINCHGRACGWARQKVEGFT